MEWLSKLNRAIEYIEDNLNKEISYDRAAQIAGCSTYYFQRMFTYVAGVTLAEYIRHRRMTQAAFELQRTDKKILDICYEYGYSSPTSFNRAFQSVHSITPVAAKNIGSKMKAFPPIKFSVEVTGENAMSYFIEQKEAMRIVGIRTSLIANMEENYKIVPDFWNQTLKSSDLSKISSLSNCSPNGLLGVTVYQDLKNIYYYIAVASNEPVPKGMHEYEIPKSTWVVIENEGCYKESVQEVFKRFYKEWLLFSGYEYAGLPDIEVYPSLNEKTVKCQSQVWIAIRKKEN